MSQGSFQKLKQAFSKQRRKQDLQKRFSQKRKQLSVQWAQQQKQIFANLLPTINEQNYEQNRSILSDYARSSTYSYQMLPIVFIVYEYLLLKPLDIHSWEIITYLSFYEDFEIPQTNQFAQTTVRFLHQYPQLSSQFLLNISKLSKCSLLCCLLIDEHIIGIISDKLVNIQEEYFIRSLQNNLGQFSRKYDLQVQIFNFLFALSYFFTIQPTLQMYHMSKICEILKFETKSNRFLKQIHTGAIFNMLSNVIERISHNEVVVIFLFQIFEENIYNTYFIYEQESIKFLNCCVQNKVLLSSRLIKQLFLSIKSKIHNSRIGVLKLLKKIITYADKIQKMQIEPNKYHTLQNFIANKSLLSFDEFNTMYTSSENPSSKKITQNQTNNYLMVVSILFTQNYEQQLKSLFSIFQTSNSQIQQEIVNLIQSIISNLIKQSQYYEPKRFREGQSQIVLPDNMQQFLILTVQHEDIYLFWSECLKSSNISLILSTLQTLEQIIFYFKQEQNEDLQQDNKQINLPFIINQIHKLSILSTIQFLMNHENEQIRNQVETLLQLINQQNN